MITAMRKGEVYYSPSAQAFMEVVDVKATYHNSDTRYIVKCEQDGERSYETFLSYELKYLLPDFQLCGFENEDYHSLNTAYGGKVTKLSLSKDFTAL